MDPIEQSIEYSKSGCNCAQSVCGPFAEKLGMDRETALKISSGFGGGIGGTAGVCGAVNGACMALGLKYGVAQPTPEEKARMYKYVQEFMEKFKAQHEALDCRDLLGYDISIPGEREKAKEEGLFTTRCRTYIESAGKILEEML
ncbi:hypothetical protein CSA56_15870 [candidate division KSB3 bacterium]|uniref:C_GCAxxG_C_C family protein n=1 Tax=candidate division KSB3 bacterium TaxID=2044937 RepID=A0A2G6K9K0_9BACT|nr:MAG: hypothetical protein CSA56_15870 [candidate division KSB3 bacterium]